MSEKPQSEKPQVGFVGAGLMGHGMAKNIVEAGYPLRVVAHRNREPIDDLKARGATEAESLGELASHSQIVILCLPGSPQVEEAVSALLSDGSTVTTIVDCSTANPVSTRRLAEEAAAKQISLLDAPLSRTPKEAWEGTLDMMIGGPEDEVERLRPLLATFAGRIVRVGQTGAGHTMKLLNNFVSLGYAAIYSEALAIGAKNGIDAETFRSVIGGGRMDCGFFQTFMQYAADRDRDAHKFAISNAHKDMRYVVALADESGIASNLSSPVKNGLAVAEALGHGADYLPMLSDVVAELNGIAVKTAKA